MNTKTPVVLAFLYTVASSPAEVLKVEQTSWDYLLYREGETAIDPATVDADFHTTWQNPTVSGYNGPTFTTAEGYFGYGSITGQDIDVNVWNPDGTEATDEPLSGERNTVYFRSTFTPTEAVTYLKFTGIIDDGVVVYLDGNEVTRLRMEPGADTWLLEADSFESETIPSRFFAAASLPADVPVTVAVSLHNVSPTSSDIGFEMGIESVTLQNPDNDLFENATELTGALPLTMAGFSDNNIGGSGAAKELGEPDHAGETGGASIWWKYTAAADGRLSVTAVSEDMNVLLAVYTGETVDALTPLRRYPRLADEASSKADSELFFEDARVEFQVEAGMTYYIAADGENGEVGQVTLTLDVGYSPLDPFAELLPAGSNWSFLIAVDDTLTPINPTILDADFYPTWRDTTLYDGPAFGGPAPAMLGYGSVNADPTETDIWEAIDPGGSGAPPSNNRRVAYFRTTFTPSIDVTDLGFEGLLDDGAIIYINKIEAERINVSDAKNANGWAVRADTPVVEDRPTETHAQYGIALDQNLPAGVPVEVAISIHNAAPSSSDLGMDLRIFAIGAMPSGDNFNLMITPAEANGSYTLSWNSIPDATYRLEFSPDLQAPWTPLPGAPITGDASGQNSETATPSIEKVFYRVVQETTP